MITISTPHSLYFSDHPIKFTFTTDNVNVERFRIQVFQAGIQVGKDINTPFFNQTLLLDFGQFINEHLRKEEGLRMPSDAVMTAYPPLSYTIKAIELIGENEQPTPSTTASFVVHRGRLPENTFDENTDIADYFDENNSFLTNYPTPEKITNGQLKYITYIHSNTPIVVPGDYSLQFQATWNGGNYSTTIPVPESWSLVLINLKTTTFNIPDVIKEFSLRISIIENPTLGIGVGALIGHTSETRKYTILEDNCKETHDVLFFNHFNQPQAFRFTDAWTVFNDAQRKNFRDQNNYRQARTFEAFRSYAANRPFLRANEITALSELKTANHVFLYEDDDWRKINITQKKWQEKEQYKFLYNLNISFSKAEKYK